MKNKIFKKKPAIKWSTVIGIIICIALAPILVMNVTIIIKSYINPDQVPDFFGIKPLVVLSGSMEPEIREGDLAISKTVDPASLKVGDIISFKEGSAIVTHRIVQLTTKDGQPAFVTKGDANNVHDGNAITYSQVEGIYVFSIGKIGYLAMFMQTPVGMLVFVGVPVCGFIIYDVVRRRLADKKEKTGTINKEALDEIDRLKAELELAKQNNKDITGGFS